MKFTSEKKNNQDPNEKLMINGSKRGNTAIINESTERDVEIK